MCNLIVIQMQIQLIPALFRETITSSHIMAKQSAQLRHSNTIHLHFLYYNQGGHACRMIQMDQMIRNRFICIPAGLSALNFALTGSVIVLI